MEQPPPALGQVAHPGLASSVTAVAADRTPQNWLRLLSQFQYGYLLLDLTGSSVASSSDRTVLKAGSELQFRTLVDDQERRGLLVFTSQDEIRRSLPPEFAARARAMVQPADTVFELLDTIGADFLLLDPASAGIIVPRVTGADALAGPRDPGMRAALERGPSTRLAVIEALVSGDGELSMGADPSMIRPNGARLLVANTSAVELELHDRGGVAATGSYLAILDRGLGEGYDGIILNPGSSGIILTRTEATAARTGRTKLASKAAEARDARQADAREAGAREARESHEPLT